MAQRITSRAAAAFAALLLACAVLLGPTQAQATTVCAAPYGVTATGQPVEIYTLHNRHGLTVTVLTYGGVIERIVAPDRRGRLTDVVLTLPDLAAYEAHPNFSSLLGRVANRISGGGFTLDGARYDLPSRADGVSSHGGVGGFGSKVWAARPFRHGQRAGVVFTYESADGENGYPGALTATVTFSLTDDNVLRLDYRAVTTRPTVVNLSHHAYFNLAGEGAVDDERLAVFADHFTPITALKLPTGEVAPVRGVFDLRTPARLGDRLAMSDPQLALAKGFDHNFVLTKTHPGALTLAARLADPASGRLLEVFTTQPGLQVYTANLFDGSIMDAAGRPIRAHAGVALETQHFPDSPNQPGFPSVVLRPGQVFTATTEYRFSIGRPHRH